MRLALHLGHANVDAMLAGMTSIEWTEWLAFLSIEPLPGERADVYAAQAAWASVAPHTSRPCKPSDFVLNFDPVAAQEAKDRRLASQFGALVARLG